MGLREIYLGVADGAEAAADRTDRLAGSVTGLGRAVASATFQPPPAAATPGGAVAPGGPLQIGTQGAPRIGTGGGGGGGSQFVTVGSPLVYSLNGGPPLPRETLERIARRMDLPTGGWVYDFGGFLYPGSDGVLAAMGGGGADGGARAGSTGGGNSFSPTGNQDRTRRLGGAAAASSTDVAGLNRSLGSKLDAIHRELQRSRGPDAATSSRVSR